MTRIQRICFRSIHIEIYENECFHSIHNIEISIKNQQTDIKQEYYRAFECMNDANIFGYAFHADALFMLQNIQVSRIRNDMHHLDGRFDNTKEQIQITGYF